MKRVIGLSGLISSGKDTVADYLVEKYQFEKLSFASSLKDVVSIVFGWERNLLEGRSPESREWRNQIDVWWAERLGIPHLTPRWVLQHWGTDVLRSHFHDEIWIAVLQNKVRKSENDIVVTDIRYPNELSAIRKLDGRIFRIERGPKPGWYEMALKANLEQDQKSIDYLNGLIHSSEWSIIGQNFDDVIDNNGSLADLYHKVDKIIEDYRELNLPVSKEAAIHEVDAGSLCILFLD